MARYYVKIDSIGKRIDVPFTSEEEITQDAIEKNWADSAFSRKIGEIRQERDQLLAATDWWGASDNTMTNAPDPTNITWPTKP